MRRVSTLFVGVSLQGCMSVSASIPELTVTRQNITFEGVPEEAVAALPGDVPEDTSTVDPADIPAELPEGIVLPASGEPYHFPSQTFSYDRLAMEMPSGTSSAFEINEVTIRAHEGSPNLAFISAIRLTVVRSDDPTGEVVTLLEYPEPGAVPTPLDRSLTLPSKAEWASVDPWKADSSVYTLDVWADLLELPTTAWAVDVELALSGSLDFST